MEVYFPSVEKADVGNSYQELEKQGVALMGWADPGHIMKS